MTIEQILLAVTPFLVYGVGELIKIVKPKITGTFLIVLVGASSGILAWVSSLALQPDLSVIVQFFFGMLSIVVHQFFKQLKSGN